MLYFKDFKEVPEERHISPAFEKMAEALAPKNFNFFSGDSGKCDDLAVSLVAIGLLLLPRLGQVLLLTPSIMYILQSVHNHRHRSGLV